LDAGAFSDEKVVKTARKIIPVFLHASATGGMEYRKQYGVTGSPTVMFVGGDEKKIEDLKSREADGMVKQIEEVAKKYPKWGGGWDHSDVAEATKAAVDGRKLMLVAFTDASDKTKKLLITFGDKSLKETLDKFIQLRRDLDPDAADDFKAELKKYKVSAIPAVIVVDPSGDEPKVVKTISGKTAKAIAKELEALLEK
jgi:thiol:disulfide interchange protein